MCDSPKNGQLRCFLSKFRSKCCHNQGRQKLIATYAVGEWDIPYPPSPPPPPGQEPAIPVPPSPPPPSYERHDPARVQGSTRSHHTQPKNTQTSGTVHFQQPVDVRFHGAGSQGPGYIRIQGGHTHASWKNFDANIPTSELVGATENQQMAIYQALALGAQKPHHHRRNHNTYNTYSYHGRANDIPSHSNSNRALPPPAPTPISASASVSAASPTTRPANNVINSSGRGSSSTKAYSSISASTGSRPTAARFCSACGRCKTPNADDVKHIRRANAVLCYGCVFAHFGAEFQRVWFES